MRRLRHGPLTLGVREGRPHRSPETTQRRPVAQRKCAPGDTPFRNPISAESCSGGPPLSPRPSLSRLLFRYFGTICRQLLLSFPFDGNRPRAFAFFSAGFGWVRHWAQQTKREEGREKEAREEGRELVGLQQGGLGLSSTASLSRGVTRTWLGGLQDSFRFWCSLRHLLHVPGGGASEGTHITLCPICGSSAPPACHPRVTADLLEF